jgi:integrase/recombinase XerD
VEYVDGFRAVLLSQGYTPVSARMQLQLMSHVSRWLADEEVAASDLTPPRVEQFLDARRAEGYVPWLSPRAVAPLLGYLRDLGVVETPASEPTATEALLARYHDWLVSQRGLAAATARGYVGMVRPFIAARAADDGVALADLTAGDVTGFVLATCRGGARGKAQQ